MHALQTAIAIAWFVFWVYWLAAAFGAKKGSGGTRQIPLRGLSALSVILLLRVFRGGSLEVHSLVLGVIGVAVFATGVALAIWARIHLGRYWGMPTTQKVDRELVTSGPYRFVRHLIYTGILIGVLGTALATNLSGVIIVGVLGAYFYYSPSVEEKNLTATFPTTIPPTEPARRCSYHSSSSHSYSSGPHRRRVAVGRAHNRRHPQGRRSRRHWTNTVSPISSSAISSLAHGSDRARRDLSAEARVADAVADLPRRGKPKRSQARTRAASCKQRQRPPRCAVERPSASPKS
jgi:protein-S-isoprenylcysteine O-methyltransferase Ste14